MNEAQILAKVRDKWAHTHLIHLESSTTLGIPDVNFCYKGKEIWVELKMLRGKTIYLERFQPVFHTIRNRHGGNCYILCANLKELYVLKFNEPHLTTKGGEAGKFLKFHVDDLPLIGHWLKPFDWDNILDTIMENANE